MRAWIKPLCVLAVFLLSACEGGHMSKEPTTSGVVPSNEKRVSVSEIERLAGKRIFFGHQSVGVNIIDGINQVIRDIPEGDLAIVETEDPADLHSPVFAHARLGENHHPGSKMEHFARIMDNGFGGKVDIALLKFCYVDVDEHTDVSRMMDEYRETFSVLKQRYPQTRFVHLTLPLKRRLRGVKPFIKKIIGRGPDFEGRNVKRNEFNRLLRKEYEGKDPIFDLARIESTYPDGSRESFRRGGDIFYALVPDYTDDGGHLNEVGQRIVAEQLLQYLASVPD